MADNPFFNSNLMALGGQMAQTWQKTLEAWWEGLLSDRDRLRRLSEQLATVGGGRRGGEPAAKAEDLAQVVEALELLGERQEALEKKVDQLAENLAAIVTYLESAQAGGGDDGEGEEER